jgi:hypothetical protein
MDNLRARGRPPRTGPHADRDRSRDPSQTHRTYGLSGDGDFFPSTWDQTVSNQTIPEQSNALVNAPLVFPEGPPFRRSIAIPVGIIPNARRRSNRGPLSPALLPSTALASAIDMSSIPARVPAKSKKYARSYVEPVHIAYRRAKRKRDISEDISVPPSYQYSTVQSPSRIGSPSPLVITPLPRLEPPLSSPPRRSGIEFRTAPDPPTIGGTSTPAAELGLPEGRPRRSKRLAAMAEVASQIGSSLPPPTIVQTPHRPKASGTRRGGAAFSRSSGHRQTTSSAKLCYSLSPLDVGVVTNTLTDARTNETHTAGLKVGSTHRNISATYGGGSGIDESIVPDSKPLVGRPPAMAPLTVFGGTEGSEALPGVNRGAIRREDRVETGIVEGLSGLQAQPNFREIVSTKNDWGQTLAHLSIFHSYASLLSHLVDWHIDLTITDVHGFTALHYAYMKGDLDSVRTLRRGGASEVVMDKLGRTPSDLQPEGFDSSIEH